MISIRYFTPAPALRPYLSSYYWFESNLPVFSDLMRAELPQVRIITTGQAQNHYATGTVRRGCGAQVQGPTSGPVRFAACGPLHLFGVGLLPQGWATLIGESADTLSDDLADLAAIIGNAPVAEVLAAMTEARDDAARVAAADRFFLGLLDRAHAAPRWFMALADDWLTSGGNPAVDTLVAASGMSARSVERLARRYYGASPKLLARKYRALNAAVQIGNGEVSGWADLAAGAFFDQAHFIREFKQFTGMTPSRFLAEAAPVTRLTIARKKLLPDLPKLALYS
ncbi:MAG: AraC family transcriptional regulator [Alphaproteobacteria bacterium PA4]|nr:MAG: AraC family transcriptional regulator [Alphaproteobacteria bacterium PA4]